MSKLLYTWEDFLLTPQIRSTQATTMLQANILKQM